MMILTSSQMELGFDPTTGSLASIQNKLAGETYGVEGDGFRVEADEFIVDSDDCQLSRLTQDTRTLQVAYEGKGLSVEIAYALVGHFVEKRLTLQTDRPYNLRKVVLSRPRFISENLLVIVPYRYQQNVTHFGRTPKGGFFTGVERPFDTSLLEGDRVTLAYRPGIKVKAGEQVVCEPAYWGVYRRYANEGAVTGKLMDGNYQHLPLGSESDAMVTMVSAVLGPPRLGPTSVLAPSCSGGIALGRTDGQWFESREELEGLKRIADFAVECGIEYFDDYLPWGGEFKTVASLAGERQVDICKWTCELLAYAVERGLKPIIWSTMTNVNPWVREPRPAFRPDKPEWRAKYLPTWRSKDEANCMGVDEYQQWLTELVLDRMAQGGYHGFSIDGDFAGNGGWFTTSSVPLRCVAENHDHIPYEAQYACERAVDRHLTAVRERYPKSFLWLMRPMMDLGVWTYRNGDAVFTILEDATVENLTGVIEQPRNVTFGDKIRVWARIRRDRHFCPHYLDQAQLFPGVDGGGSCKSPWDGTKLDYLMLSAISTTPNQCYFTGPIDAISLSDRAVIRQWLDWSREHAAYLMVRKALPDWPTAGKVDGSAHIIRDQGYVFLFNPNPQALDGDFTLDESIGLIQDSRFRVECAHPSREAKEHLSYGERVSWKVLPQSAVLLHVAPEP